MKGKEIENKKRGLISRHQWPIDIVYRIGRGCCFLLRLLPIYLADEEMIIIDSIIKARLLLYTLYVVACFCFSWRSKKKIQPTCRLLVTNWVRFFLLPFLFFLPPSKVYMENTIYVDSQSTCSLLFVLTKMTKTICSIFLVLTFSTVIFHCLCDGYRY